MSVRTPWKEFEIRRYRVGEEEKMAALVAAAGTSSGDSLVTVDLIRDEWADPRLVLERDTWVAVDEADRYIAAAEVWPEGNDENGEVITRHIGFTIHPDYRMANLDLMQYLFDRAAQHASDLPTPHENRAYYLRAWAAAQDRWKQQWIVDQGFDPVFSSYTFRHTRLDEVAPPEPVGAVAVVPWTPERDRELWRLINEGFTSDETVGSIDWDEWLRFYHGDGMVPQCWGIAQDEQSGALVGLSMCEMDRYAPRPTGWITALGVVSSYRGRGIGRALLQATLSALRDNGAAEVQMAVDDLYHVLAPDLYQSVGFEIMKGSHVYHRLIRDRLV